MPPAPRVIPPVVVAEGRDLMFFKSEADVSVYLEPWFPSTAEYRVFDSEGRRLELFADPPVVSRRLIGPIWIDNAHESSLCIRALEEQPRGADELTAMLREWLPRVGVVLEPGREVTLDQLLAKATESTGFLS